MDDQLYFRNVPAFSFPFIELPQAQLDLLLSNTRFILERLDRAKKGAVVLNHLRIRVRDKQVVRCTPQSVKATAAARYAPNSEDLNLSSITTSLFVNLITYLPLPEIRVLAGNQDALHEASKMSMDENVEQRWGTYYTCLGAVNREWAKLFFNEIQQQLVSSNGGMGRQPGARTDDGTGNNRMIDDPTTPTIFDDKPNTRVGGSKGTAYSRQEALADQEMFATTSDMEDEAHATDNSWQQNTYPTLDNTDDLAFQQEENMYIKVLRAKEKAWGLDHQTTFETVGKLAEFYAHHGKVQEAETMYLRILQASESQVGNDHSEH